MEPIMVIQFFMEMLFVVLPRLDVHIFRAQAIMTNLLSSRMTTLYMDRPEMQRCRHAMLRPRWP
eukprot:9072800-Pyramimonas_sp.AAC.1